MCHPFGMNAASFGFLRERAPERMAEILDFRIAYSLRSEIRKKIFEKIFRVSRIVGEHSKKLCAPRSAHSAKKARVAKSVANAALRQSQPQIRLDGGILSFCGLAACPDGNVRGPGRERAPVDRRPTAV